MAFSLNGFVAAYASGSTAHNILAYRGYGYVSYPAGGGYAVTGNFPSTGTFRMSLFFQQGAYVQYYSYSPPPTTGG